MTLPQLDRSKYPPYVAPTGEALPQMRTLRSLRMITEGPKISYEQLIAKKHSTRMELADKVLPDLLKAASRTPMPGGCWRSGTASPTSTAAGPCCSSCSPIDTFAAANGGMADKLRVKYDPARPLDSAYGLGRSAARPPPRWRPLRTSATSGTARST